MASAVDVNSRMQQATGADPLGSEQGINTAEADAAVREGEVTGAWYAGAPEDRPAETSTIIKELKGGGSHDVEVVLAGEADASKEPVLQRIVGKILGQAGSTAVQ